MKTRYFTILCAGFVGACSAGCVPGEGGLEEGAAVETVPAALSVRDLLADGPQQGNAGEGSAEPLRVVARIGTGPLDYIEWSVVPGRPDTAGVGVAVSFPKKPLLTTSFIEAHSAVEVFLAVAPVDMDVPKELLVYFTEGEPIDVGARRRQALAAEARSLLDALPGVDMSTSEDAGPLAGTNAVVDTPQAASCSTTFKNWVSDVYGEDGTCGKETQTIGYSRQETYCAYGMCDFKLPASGIAECNASTQWGLKLEACDYLKGTLTGVKGRVVNWNGDASWNHGGHRVHTGVGNCTGNGNVKYVETRGTFSATHLVAENHMYHYFRGPGVKRPKTSWAHGAWATDTPASGSTYQTCKLEVTQNSATNDRIIACVDWEVSYDMANASPPQCHGQNAKLCTTDCDTACFDIVGY